MKPRSRQESQARMEGYEVRHVFQQGSKTAKVARGFTRKQSNKAMRHQAKRIIKEELEACYD